MNTFTLQRRDETDQSTWGELSGPDGALICKTLERGPRNPAHKRIPAGTYRLDRKPLSASHFDGAYHQRYGEGYKGILWLPEVPGRSNIEMHTANWISQLEGCIAAATAIARDVSGNFMAAESREAYGHLYPLISAAIDDGGAEIVVKDI